MIFQHVDMNSQRLIDGSSSDCENIRSYCRHLLDGLEKFFASNSAKVNLGASFKFEDDLLCALATPYGNARGRLTIQLVNGVMEGRYVFEKSVVSTEGKDVWSPIWAIRIGRYANVWLGDEGELEIEVMNPGPHNNSFSATAKSLLYRIAITPIFKQ